MSGTVLISVSDKRNIERLGLRFEALGWSILSTGGTAEVLRGAGCNPTEISDFTGFPEMLDGRVKTLHPKVFAGILAAPTEDHRAQLSKLDLPEIDVVVVNLYPFRETVARDGVTLAQAIEQIDIGGPSLIRAAAKNFARTTILVDPDDYETVLEEMLEGGITEETRRGLAIKAYRHTAAYDAAISAHLPGLVPQGQKSRTASVAHELLMGGETTLRYGENPHQWGLVARSVPPSGLASARQIQGKELSYNNLGDATGAWRLVWDLPAAGVAVIKHANPCGVALDEAMDKAFLKARATDPVSAFGGVIAANRKVDRAFAEAVVENFAEVVIAPGYSDEALEVFATKKNLRVLEAEKADETAIVLKTIDGGFVVQQADSGWGGEGREAPTERKPTEAESRALELAWRVVKHVGSNAIVVGAEDRILGIGAGQMSRVDAAKIAVAKAVEMGHELQGSVAASDAFFPFPDGVEVLNQAGVVAVIQPGGSIRDSKVIDACDEMNVAMVMTGRRHFKHG